MNYIKIDNLTVGQYQELYSIHTSQDDDIDKVIASVAILTGKPRWEVEEMSLKAFTESSRDITALFLNPQIKEKVVKSVRVNGKKYAVILNARKLSYGQYVDIQHFLKGNMIDNLHKLMACLLVPVKYGFLKGKYDGENHEKIAEGIRALKFYEVHSTCIFFSKLWNLSIKAIQEYLTKELTKAMKTKNLPEIITTTDLQRLLDGYLTLSR